MKRKLEIDYNELILEELNIFLKMNKLDDLIQIKYNDNIFYLTNLFSSNVLKIKDNLIETINSFITCNIITNHFINMNLSYVIKFELYNEIFTIKLISTLLYNYDLHNVNFIKNLNNVNENNISQCIENEINLKDEIINLQKSIDNKYINLNK